MEPPNLKAMQAVIAKASANWGSSKQRSAIFSLTQHMKRFDLSGFHTTSACPSTCVDFRDETDISVLFDGLKIYSLDEDVVEFHRLLVCRHAVFAGEAKSEAKPAEANSEAKPAEAKSIESTPVSTPSVSATPEPAEMGLPDETSFRAVLGLIVDLWEHDKKRTACYTLLKYIKLHKLESLPTPYSQTTDIEDVFLLLKTADRVAFHQILAANQTALQTVFQTRSAPAAETRWEFFALPARLQYLPAEALAAVFAFLGPRDKFLLCLDSKPFAAAVEKLREFALMKSHREVLDYFWRYDKKEVEASVKKVFPAAKVYWAAMKLKGGLRETQELPKRYLQLRKDLMSWVDDTTLKLTASKFTAAFKGVTLLASTKIARLDISETPAVDLSPLSNLINLKDLVLWDTFVTDISPVSSLKNLKILDLAWL